MAESGTLTTRTDHPVCCVLLYFGYCSAAQQPTTNSTQWSTPRREERAPRTDSRQRDSSDGDFAVYLRVSGLVLLPWLTGAHEAVRIIVILERERGMTTPLSRLQTHPKIHSDTN